MDERALALPGRRAAEAPRLRRPVAERGHGALPIGASFRGTERGAADVLVSEAEPPRERAMLRSNGRRRPRDAVAVVVALVLSAAGATTARAGDDLDWRVDLERALEDGARDGRPVAVYVMDGV